MTNNPVADAIAEYWGERCSDYEPNCPCCQAWAQYDALTSASASAAAAAMEMRERAASSDLWLPLIQEQSEGEWTQKQIEQDADNFGAAVRAIPIDPDDQKALDKMLAKAREDAIREAASVSGQYLTTEADELLADMWREDILALLTDGGRDE